MSKTVYYHGTNKDFDQFEKKESVREGFLGHQTKVKSDAFFFTTNHSTADIFAQNRAENLGGEAIVKAYELEFNNPLDLTGNFKHERYGNSEHGCLDTDKELLISSRQMSDQELLLMNNKAAYDKLCDILNVDLVSEDIADYDLIDLGKGLPRKQFFYNKEELLLLLDNKNVVDNIKKHGYDSAVCFEGQFEGTELGQSVAVFSNDQIKEIPKPELKNKKRSRNKI